MSNNIQFDISIAYKDFVNSINKMSDSVNGFVNKSVTGLDNTKNIISKDIPAATDKSSAAISNMSAQSNNSFSSMTAGVFAGQLAFGIFSQAVSFAKDTIIGSLGAYAEQEDAVNKLTQALNGVNDGSAQSVESVMNFSSALEANSKFADDAIAKQVAFVISLGVTKTRAQEIVTAAANMSAVLGGSLDENVDKLGKTLSGTTGRLGQYIPELKNLTDEQLKAGAAADIINKKWSGASANDIKTYSGSVAQLRNAFNNLQETIGGAIINSNLFKGALSSTKGLVDDINKALELQAIKQRAVNGEQTKGSRTVEQLANDHKILKAELDKITGEITNADSHGIFNIFYPTALLKQQKEDIQKQINDLDAILSTASSKDYTIKGDPKIVKELTKEEIAAQKTIILNHQNMINEKYRITEEGNNNLLELQHKADIDNQNLNIEASDITLAQKQEAYQAVLEQRLAQEQADLEAKQANQALELQLVYEHEMAKAQIIFDSNERKKATQEAQDKYTLGKAQLASKQEVDLVTLNSAQQKAVLEMSNKNKKELDAQNVANRRDTLSTISTLSKSSNKELAIIGKAAGIAQIAIDTPVAISKALAAFPPPYNFIAAGLVGTAMAAQAANIAGLQFEQGGIVPGSSFTGDNVSAQVNSGEMILNRQQQANLFNIANNGGNNNSQGIIDRLSSLEQAILSRPMVLVADDNEIARSTSRGVMNGIEIGRSR